MPAPFVNEPLTDFSDGANRDAFEAALRQVKNSLGEEYPLLIGGQEVRTSGTFRSYNPARKDEVIGVFHKANAELAERAVEEAHLRFETWKRVPAEERAQILFRAAELLRERKHEFSARMVLEVGKSWVEADADTAEAIDFLDFYGHDMLRLGGDQSLVEIPTEDNSLQYIPLGVVSVIPPWNFPLAIMAGMTVAAVVTGNTVVLKPSSDAPAIAYHFVTLFEEAGCPPGVVNFIPGSGSIAGEAIVRHHLTRMIAFTGSREVGLGINETAARTQPGQKWIKRVIAEMGGKDAIVVDASANTDEVAAGIVAAAFGYQGQKCSACSRAIIHTDIYDEVVEKVVLRTKEIRQGAPDNHDHFMGPVINRSAFAKILEYVETGRAEGRLLIGGDTGDDAGYYIRPTIFADVDPHARISQEEIFGPVLAMTRADDIDEALRIANDTDYGLTGALYSADEDVLARAREEFHVGNLYLNRKCTGALVGVHPFGGFNMSGTDSKAGGHDYLLLFTQAKVTSRKV